MTKPILTLLAVAVTAFTVSACTTTPADLPPGKYEKTSTSVSSNGTEYTTKKSTDVEYDSYGNKKAVVKSKTTQDPKGLFNKTTSETERTYEEK